MLVVGFGGGGGQGRRELLKLSHGGLEVGGDGWCGSRTMEEIGKGVYSFYSEEVE